jgi:hypothetical protein
MTVLSLQVEVDLQILEFVLFLDVTLSIFMTHGEMDGMEILLILVVLYMQDLDLVVIMTQKLVKNSVI